MSVQFSKHDNDLVYDGDFDLSAPTRSRRGTTGDKAKVESRRKARSYCGKFWGYVGLVVCVLLGGFLIADLCLTYLKDGYAPTSQSAIV